VAEFIQYQKMNIKEFQNLCADVVEKDIVEKIDKKNKVKRNPQLSFTQLMEEIGELAKAVNLPKLRNKKLDQNNLSEEFADVFYNYQF